MCPARLMNAQKVSIVQLHLKNGGHASETVRQFKVLYPTNRTLVPSTVLKVVATFLEHGSVENRWKGTVGGRKLYALLQTLPPLEIQWQQPPLPQLDNSRHKTLE